MEGPLPLGTHRAGPRLSAAGQPTMQLVVGFPPGQALDAGARIAEGKMGEDLKQTMYVDNRAGATGIMAQHYVKNAAPDGYTLL